MLDIEKVILQVDGALKVWCVAGFYTRINQDSLIIVYEYRVNGNPNNAIQDYEVRAFWQAKGDESMTVIERHKSREEAESRRQEIEAELRKYVS